MREEAEPTCVTIVGTAGVGKSQLLTKYQDNNRPVQAVEDGCIVRSTPVLYVSLRENLTVTDVEGNAELVCYASGKGLMRMWAELVEGPRGRSGWSTAPLAYDPVNTTLTQRSTYRTTLVFSDADGVFLANQAVELRATAIVGGSIEGEFVMLGPTRPIKVNTDSRGRVRITLPTGALDVAQLSARVPGLTAADEDFAVSPDAPIRNRLATATLSDVQQFINPDYLNSAVDVQKTLHEVMGSVSDGTFPVVRRRVGARPDLKTPIATGGRRGRAHSFSVVNGHATFRYLTKAEALQRRAELAGLSPEGLSPEGLFDWFEDAIETIGNALEDAANWTYHHVIEPVAKGISVALKFVTDTITVVWNGIIETVEDAFRFVKTVFEAVKTFFKRLYDFLAWLLSNARKDIWATKTHFERLANQGFTSLAGYAAQGASISHSFFTDLAGTVDSLFDQIERRLGTLDGNQALNAGLPGAREHKEGAESVLDLLRGGDAEASWLFDKVMEILGLRVGGDLPGILIDDAKGILAQVGTAVGNEIETLMTGFLNQLQTLASSTQSLGNALLSTVLSEAKALLLAILRLLDTLVQAVLTFFAKNLPTIATSVFGASIGGFVLQQLYDLMNPGTSEDLTVLGLGCLVAGFTTTVLYKLLMDEAPYSSKRASTGQVDPTFIVAGLLQCGIWLEIDAILDSGAKKAEAPWFFLSITFLVPLLIQLLMTPPGSPSFGNDKDKSKWVAWFVGFGAPAWKAIWGILMYAGIKNTGPRRSAEGAGGLCLCGVAVLGTNIWKSVENSDDAWGWISTLLSPLSLMVKPFGVKDGGRLLVITDFVSDGGGGIAKIIKGAGTAGNDNQRQSGRALALRASGLAPRRKGEGK